MHASQNSIIYHTLCDLCIKDTHIGIHPVTLLHSHWHSDSSTFTSSYCQHTQYKYTPYMHLIFLILFAYYIQTTQTSCSLTYTWTTSTHTIHPIHQIYSCTNSSPIYTVLMPTGFTLIDLVLKAHTMQCHTKTDMSSIQTWLPHACAIKCIWPTDLCSFCIIYCALYKDR